MKINKELMNYDYETYNFNNYKTNIVKINRSSIFKYGNILCISLNINITTTGDSLKIGQLPSNLTPEIVQELSCSLSNGNAVRCWVASNDGIYINFSTLNYQVYISGCIFL